MKRRAVFFLLTLFLPFLFFAAIEFSLRFLDYGENLELVVEREVLGKKFFSLNRAVAKRYFAGSAVTIPEPPEDLFSITKGKKTLRIFCLGESTMAGFPYEFNATAPAFLQAELKSFFPGFEVEVINAGLSAIGTFVVRDFLVELLNFEPDLFVVYVGHNEFYGVFGPASSVGTSLSPIITDLSICLSKFKTFLALRDLLAWMLPGKEEPPEGTLMEQMVGRQWIPYKNETYEFGREIYARNLELIIAAAQEAGVPIMFSALVSNIADQSPFLSFPDPSLPHESAQQFSRLLFRGDSLLTSGSPSHALKAYQSAVMLDQLHAGSWFGCGQAMRQLGDSIGALQAFLRAKDLDALRFRMTEEFQQNLRTVCRKMGVPVSPADSAFTSASPLGLPGNTLILEHVHPNIRGYALLAHTWAMTILRDSLLAPRGKWTGPIPPFDANPLNQVTEFDSTVGQIRTAFLTRRWPFREERSYRFVARNPIEEIALNYVQKKIPWQVARYEAAAYYVGQQRFDLARREAGAVATVIPFSYEPLLRIADYYMMEEKRTEAEAAYRNCLNVEENPFAYSKLGLIYLHEERFGDAVTVLNNAFAAEGRTRHRLTTEVAASNRYLLGFAYARQQKRAEAIREIKRALALNPGHSAARDLLSQLEK